MVHQKRCDDMGGPKKIKKSSGGKVIEISLPGGAVYACRAIGEHNGNVLLNGKRAFLHIHHRQRATKKLNIKSSQAHFFTCLRVIPLHKRQKPSHIPGMTGNFLSPFHDYTWIAENLSASSLLSV